MNDWVHALRHAGERGLDAILVTVVSGKGSIPREAGAKLVVTSEASHGTIGGGELEFQAVDIARGMLGSPAKKQSQRFPLGASLGQFCGGAANLFFERVPAAAGWVRVLGEWLEAGTECIAARPAGDEREGYLLVRADTTWGSLGSEMDDASGAAMARAMLCDALQTLRLTPLQGVGPESELVLFERVQPAEFNVVLFGAGHVGRAVVRILGTLACSVTWVDSRAEQFPRSQEIPANVRVAQVAAPLEEVGRARPNSYFLVMTHSHALDFDLVAAILERRDSAYCGMIGSETKRRTFESGFAKRGLSGAALARFTCPIGIAALKGKEPATIAVGVAAQLLELRERAERAAHASAVTPP